ASFFNFRSLHPNIENHVDDNNKIISLKRWDPSTGQKIYALINLGHREIFNYRFGVDELGAYKIAIDSDRGEFGGEDRLHKATPEAKLKADVNGEHGKAHSLSVPVVAPYSVILFEQLP